MISIHQTGNLLLMHFRNRYFMNKRKLLNLKVLTIGKPSVESMPKNELNLFCNTILEQIIKSKSEDNNSATKSVAETSRLHFIN